MNRSCFRAPLAVVLAAAMLAVPVRGWAGDPAPETLEKQIACLRDTFAEAIRSRDWKLLELAAKGFKASGLKGDKLELEMLRAERDAALNPGSGMMMMGRSNTVQWGQACRAMIYGGSALTELRELAKSNPAPVKAPDAALAQNDMEAYQASLKAYNEYLAFVDDRNRAIFCLAMMKEPGMDKRALECLLQPATPPAGMGMYMAGVTASRDLMLALMAADAKSGWQQACSLLDKPDAEYSFDQKLAMLSGLSGLFSNMTFGTMKFTVDGEVLANLPQSARADLVKPYLALVKAYQPKQGAAMDYTGNTLANLSVYLPKTEQTEELVKALEELKAKFTGPNAQFITPMLAQAIARMQAKGENAREPNTGAQPVKPGKAPDDF